MRICIISDSTSIPTDDTIVAQLQSPPLTQEQGTAATSTNIGEPTHFLYGYDY